MQIYKHIIVKQVKICVLKIRQLQIFLHLFVIIFVKYKITYVYLHKKLQNKQ